MKLIQSKNIKDYKEVLEGLIDDFGYTYWHSILRWCEIIDKKEETYFWQVFLIKVNDEIVGICGLYSLKEGTEELWLGWFGILSEFRNNGLGTEILGKLEKKAKKLNCKTLFVYVDFKGKPLNFYYRNGFRDVSRVEEFIEKNSLTMDEFENPADFVLKKDL